MQYIALAFDTPEPQLTDLTQEVLTLAQAAGYRPRADWLEMAGDGLPAFVQSRRITRVVFLNCPSRPSLKVSSDGITEDVAKSAWDGRPSAFEGFLAAVTSVCAEWPFYVVMGEEWFVYQYVRYHEGPLAKLATILHLNRSWRAQLYNFETESNSDDSETPLIFRVMPGPGNTTQW
ncbi:hypothetical protein [Hymenobacter terrestris]|uniref:Uncharacterized protein n=1 Tax=Hymenobacter terrestris TaxID=2748310 RepID=A0ABX2Q5D3_9BACT|nr:hypothetical protein [Hymenobacter terrestris]NVO86182.1 hypothetical protein [Hymenobacter terrestris]